MGEKPKKERKERIIKVRFTEKEYQDVVNLTKLEGKNISDTIRKCISTYEKRYFWQSFVATNLAKSMDKTMAKSEKSFGQMAILWPQVQKPTFLAKVLATDKRLKQGIFGRFGQNLPPFIYM